MKVYAMQLMSDKGSEGCENVNDTGKSLVIEMVEIVEGAFLPSLNAIDVDIGSNKTFPSLYFERFLISTNLVSMALSSGSSSTSSKSSRPESTITFCLPLPDLGNSIKCSFFVPFFVQGPISGLNLLNRSVE